MRHLHFILILCLALGGCVKLPSVDAMLEGKSAKTVVWTRSGVLGSATVRVDNYVNDDKGASADKISLEEHFIWGGSAYFETTKYRRAKTPSPRPPLLPQPEPAKPTEPVARDWP